LVMARCSMRQGDGRGSKDTELLTSRGPYRGPRGALIVYERLSRVDLAVRQTVQECPLFAHFRPPESTLSGHCRSRPNWPDSAPTRSPRRGTRVRAIAVIPLRARDSPHRPKSSLSNWCPLDVFSPFPLPLRCSYLGRFSEMAESIYTTMQTALRNGQGQHPQTKRAFRTPDKYLVG
jgi:hypothetical protein